ncbi:hypothetical protein QFZ58_002224 [Streptomyces sp. B1I3]|nr:hypothetical protein [Streptomyces sp. B1I3]
MDMQTWRDARARAVDASDGLQTALAAVGVPESARSTVRPVVTHKGVPYVHVGMVRAEVAEQIAEAMNTSVRLR